MVSAKFASLDAFLDEVAFDLWTRDHVAVLTLDSSTRRSSGGIDVSYKWAYAGGVPKSYNDGFFCSHEDAREVGGDIRNADDELKDAQEKLVKKGVVSMNNGSRLSLKLADGFPTGLAADFLKVAECKLVPVGKFISALRLFELGRRYNRTDRQIYENICAYFSKK